MHLNRFGLLSHRFQLVSETGKSAGMSRRYLQCTPVAPDGFLRQVRAGLSVSERNVRFGDVRGEFDNPRRRIHGFPVLLHFRMNVRQIQPRPRIVGSAGHRSSESGPDRHDVN